MNVLSCMSACYCLFTAAISTHGHNVPIEVTKEIKYERRLNFYFQQFDKTLYAYHCEIAVITEALLCYKS